VYVRGYKIDSLHSRCKDFFSLERRLGFRLKHVSLLGLATWDWELVGWALGPQPRAHSHMPIGTPHTSDTCVV
jgi:hypothetical protein